MPLTKSQDRLNSPEVKAPLAAALALLLFAPASAQVAPGHFKKSLPKAMPERLVLASDALLGVKYLEFPMGEGPQGRYDSDPFVRLDRVDCVTFVEQSLAMARARTAEGMLEELTRIRYKNGVMTYQDRNHFTEADWLPNNIAAGIVRDITAEVAGSDTRTITKLISKRAWYAAKTVKDLKGPRIQGLSEAEKQALVDEWRASGASIPDQTVSLAYLPIEKLGAHARDIPSGTIVSLVRADKPSIPTIVSHMGLIVQKDGHTYLRHAAQNDRVIDVLVPGYFDKYKTSKWALLGLNLAAPAELTGPALP